MSRKERSRAAMALRVPTGLVLLLSLAYAGAALALSYRNDIGFVAAARQLPGKIPAAAARAWGWVVGPSGRVIVFDGNSLTAGRAVEPGERYPARCLALLGPGWEGHNLGVSSQTTGDMLADADREVDRLARGRSPVLVAWEVTNDIYFGAAAGEAFARFADYCRGRRAAGYQVVVLTVLPRNDFPGTSRLPEPQKAEHEARRREVNRLLRAGWAEFADALADVAADDRLGDDGDELDRRYYADKVHLTPEGYRIVAGHVAEALRRLPAPGE
ncbi:MAG TPA: SGNH/GDSL hydrolase family protein [Gemmataceae bacterium]